MGVSTQEAHDSLDIDFSPSYQLLTRNYPLSLQVENSIWNTKNMTIDNRRKYLGAKSKGARLKANAQRKYSRTSQGQPQSDMGNRHRSLTQAVVARELGMSQSFLLWR
jgi:hypothetical protein